MRRILAIIWLAPFVVPAFSAEAVYRNGPAEMHAFNVYDPGTITNGSTQEVGDSVTLAGTSRVITEVTAYYILSTGAGTFQADETIRIRFYNLDGPPIGGNPSPGTMIWDSGPVSSPGVWRAKRIAVPNVTVPNTFAWTLQPGGVNQAAGDTLGAQVFGPPTVGSSDDSVWHRAEPSAPWTATGFIGLPGDFGFDIWAGPPTVAYDNTIEGSNFFDPDIREYGDDVTMEGAGRTATLFSMTYYPDIAAPVGNEGAILRLYRRLPDYQGSPEASPFFTSAEVPIDATAGTHTLMIPISSVVVPDQFVWTIQWTHVVGGAGDQVGPFLRTPPNPGASNIIFFIKDGIGINGFQQYWFGDPAAGNPVGNLSARLDVAAGATIITEDSVTLGPGIVLSGTPADLNTSNDVYYTVRPGVVISSSQSPIVLTWIGHAPGNNPSSLSSTVEARAQQANCRQTIEVFNYTSGLYEQLNQQVLPTSTPDTVVTSNIANPSQHIGTGNEVKLKISYKTVGPILSYPWRIFMDQVIETYTP